MNPKSLANETWLANAGRQRNQRVVVLLSGGIDSAAVAVVLADAGYEIAPLFIDYGQAARDAELRAARALAAAAGFQEPHVLKSDLYHQLGSLLPEHARTDRAAWVPARNTLFMLVAGIYAHAVEADGIALGYMLDDNFVFGDNDYFHHRLLELLLEKSFLRPFEVLLPASALSKDRLIALLAERDLLHLTVSCWNARVVDGLVVECGECANCREKGAALAGQSS